jgi:hypothetical protein
MSDSFTHDGDLTTQEKAHAQARAHALSPPDVEYRHRPYPTAPADGPRRWEGDAGPRTSPTGDDLSPRVDAAEATFVAAQVRAAHSTAQRGRTQRRGVYN